MEQSLLRTLVGVNVDYFRVENRRATLQVDTGITDKIEERITLALQDNNTLRFVLLNEIYEFYRAEPYFTSLFKPLFERKLIEKGVLAKFTQFANHALSEDYIGMLRSCWLNNPGSKKPAPLLETFRLYFKRKPGDVSQFTKTFTNTDRLLLNLD